MKLPSNRYLIMSVSDPNLACDVVSTLDVSLCLLKICLNHKSPSKTIYRLEAL